jgi:hypothetical protein
MVPLASHHSSYLVILLISSSILSGPTFPIVDFSRNSSKGFSHWWCGQWRMTHTHVFLPCVHPCLESARKEIWDRPDEDARIPTRPTSIGQLLGKAKWEKTLADWIVATGVGLLGPGKQDYEDRLERNDGWRREPLV